MFALLVHHRVSYSHHLYGPWNKALVDTQLLVEKKREHYAFCSGEPTDFFPVGFVTVLKQVSVTEHPVAAAEVLLKLMALMEATAMPMNNSCACSS